jgi:hypothetical protein
MIPRNEIGQRIQSQTGLNAKEVIAVLFFAPDNTIETRSADAGRDSFPIW